MASGVVGTNIPANISNQDIAKYVDIFYSYSPSRNSSVVNQATFEKLSADNLRNVIATADGEYDTIVEGLYNLQLPVNLFGKKGIYTIYIKPKEIPVTISAVSTLKDFPCVRGIVLDINALDDDIKTDAQTNNGLVGYRVIFRNNDGTRSDDVRVITSNNRCEPSITVLSANSKSYSYQYNESATHTFLTVSPSMPLSFKGNSSPYIGTANQKIYLVNTLFEPVCLELEMVENDADTLANMINGNQVRDLNKGLITTFNEAGEITYQHEMSTLKTSATSSPQYEVKENKKNNIDFSQTINDKLS